MVGIAKIQPREEVRANRTPGSYAQFEAAVTANPLLTVEFMDGEIYMTPAPAPIHQLVSVNVIWELDSYVRKKALGEMLGAPLEVELDPGTQIVQSDLIFIRKERLAALIGTKRITGAPDLAVEITSPSTARADRFVKLMLYARYGVAEYWIVDVDEQAVTVHVLEGERYRVAGVFLAEDRDGEGMGDGTMINVGQFAEAGIEVDRIFAFG